MAKVRVAWATIFVCLILWLIAMIIQGISLLVDEEVEEKRRRISFYENVTEYSTELRACYGEQDELRMLIVDLYVKYGGIMDEEDLKRIGRGESK